MRIAAENAEDTENAEEEKGFRQARCTAFIHGVIRFTQSNCANGERTPTAFHPSAQGCARRATLGSAAKNATNPERVSASSGSRTVDSTPTGLALILDPEPRVARPSQPWAGGWNAVGVRPEFVERDCENRMSCRRCGAEWGSLDETQPQALLIRVFRIFRVLSGNSHFRIPLYSRVRVSSRFSSRLPSAVKAARSGAGSAGSGFDSPVAMSFFAASGSAA